MELRDYLRMLRRGALTIAVLTVAALLVGLAYLRATPKVYQASAAVLVMPSAPDTIGDLQAGVQLAQSSSATMSALISTQAVMQPAAQALSGTGLTTTYSADQLLGSVSASAAEGSAVIVITASSGSPEQASAMANGVAEQARQTVPGLFSADRATRAPLLALQVIQDARTPSSPVSPNAKRVMVLFGVIGLVLGLTVTLVRQSLDSRLRRADDVTSMTQIPVLATIARERRSKRAVVAARDAPASPAVEGYRALRTSLAQIETLPRCSVLVAPVSDDVTSARVPGNLAWSLAQAGRRVLLVDLDLRHDAIGELFDLSSTTGAADALTGAVALAAVIQSTDVSDLDVVVAGRPEQAPSDLLSNQRLEHLVREAEGEYDVVVIHAPALLSFTDAAVVARVAGHTVVSVRADFTRAPDLTSAVGVLTNVGVAPLGLVMTGSKVAVVDTVRQRTRPQQAVAPRPGRRSRRASTTSGADV